MKREASKLLLDIREAISAITEFTQGMTFQEYLVDARTQAAVERKFEIVGEACSRLRDRCPEVFETIESGPQIIGLRNRLIHGYDQVDDSILWDVLQSKLPALDSQLPKP